MASSLSSKAGRRWRAALLVACALLVLSAKPALASGVDPTRISLPKGPGSIEGLGRNFSASLASGTSSYGLDIAIPPAVGGFGPKTSLDYDSGGGVGELGIGWRLGGIPSIRRRTENGLPRFDESDVFELSGFGIPADLLEVAPDVYRPEHESGSFVRVQRASDGQRWEARDKSGTTHRFGGEGFAESEDGNVARYLLREQLDLHGHRIRYEWDTSEGHALLKRIAWNDFSEKARIEVAIDYESRPDVHLRFSSGIRQTVNAPSAPDRGALRRRARPAVFAGLCRDRPFAPNCSQDGRHRRRDRAPRARVLLHRAKPCCGRPGDHHSVTAGSEPCRRQQRAHRLERRWVAGPARDAAGRVPELREPRRATLGTGDRLERGREPLGFALHSGRAACRPRRRRRGGPRGQERNLELSVLPGSK